jgi:hypothetical protein
MEMEGGQLTIPDNKSLKSPGQKPYIGGQSIIKNVEVDEKLNFFIDLLCDDFCEIDEHGQYSIKPDVREDIEKEMHLIHMNAPLKPPEDDKTLEETPKDSHVFDVPKNFKTGRWLDDEHE